VYSRWSLFHLDEPKNRREPRRAGGADWPRGTNRPEGATNGGGGGGTLLSPDCAPPELVSGGVTTKLATITDPTPSVNRTCTYVK